MISRFLKFLIFSFGCCLILFSQSEDESFLIKKINIEYKNFKIADKSYILSAIPIKEGGQFNSKLSDQSVQSLYDTGYFSFVDINLLSDDSGVEVYIKLTSKYKMEGVNFIGNKSISSNRLLEKSNLKNQEVVNEYLINKAINDISDFYKKKGFSDIFIEYSVEKDIDEGTAKVNFKIDEREKKYIQSIEFIGLRLFKKRDILKGIESRERGIFSWIMGDGVFNKDILLEDIQKIKMLYQNKGFLDVEIDPNKIEYDFTKNKKGKIKIYINEGDIYQLGLVDLEGATIFTKGELLQSLRLKKGIIFSPLILSQFIEIIKEYYTSRGFLETRVFYEKIVDIEKRKINIIIKIFESEKYYLNSIFVEGNTKSKNKLIIRELVLDPSEVFDYKRMETSEVRLKNTGYFEQVKLTPENTNIPGRKNLNILVKEAKTGAFSFGAGFGSVRSSSFFLDFRQSNFDFKNWRSGFQGAGQKLRVRIATGRLSNDQIISFQEPWLFDRQLAFGAKLYNSESEYVSNDFSERRTGIEFSFRKRLFELFEGKLTYNYETVSIYDVDFANPLTFYNQLLDETTIIGPTGQGNYNGIFDNTPQIANQEDIDSGLWATEGSYQVIATQEYLDNNPGSNLVLNQVINPVIDEIVDATNQAELLQGQGFIDANNNNVWDPTEEVFLDRRNGIPDISEDGIPDEFQKSIRDQIVSKIGFTLLRDNRNSFLFTSSGSRTSILTEFAGLGGDVNYFKFDLNSAQFFPTFNKWNQSFSLITRLGLIAPLGNDIWAPFYDRFYLGGPESLRGYDYRDIGPRDLDVWATEEAIGGHTYGLISLEYLFRPEESFGFVVFYDGGFCNWGESDWSMSENNDPLIRSSGYVDNYGLGIRILLMGSPLKLDYGIPLNSPSYLDSSPQFHFSFGGRY